MKKTTNVTKIAVGFVLLVVGYVAGVTIGFPPLKSDKVQGSASMITQNEEDPDVKAMRELLSKNKNANRQAILATAFLSTHINELDSIANAGLKATEGNKATAKVNQYFVGLKDRTSKAKSSLQAFEDASNRMANGEKVEDFDELYNNTIISFALLDETLSNDGIGDMLDFTREAGNDVAANSISGLLTICGENEVVKNNKADYAMWEKAFKKK